MKKFLPYILILVCVVGLFSPMGRTNAQDLPSTPVPQTPTTLPKAPTPTPIPPADPCVGGNLPNGSPCVSAANAQAMGAGNSNKSACSAWSIFCLTDILSAVAYAILKILSLILALTGLLLNFVIDKTIIQMADNIKGMTGINVAWKVLRDLMNIAFIFLLVYEGILIIIGQKTIATIKTFITGIVLASLLINFSLFFTKVIIDASNIVTIGLYKSVIDDTSSTPAGTASGDSGIYVGLSSAYMKSLGLTAFWNPKGIDIGSNGGSYGQLTTNLMASVLILVTSFIFLAISVMFVVRYLVLILLLVLSPIAYMGMAGIPGIKKHAEKWWSTLWGQILFAPVYMLMTWVVLTLISSGNFAGTAGSLTPGTSWPDISGSINVLFNFAIIIGLSIASLITAKSFATQGASEIGKFTAGATAFAGNAVMGGAARLQRNTIGRAGAAMANDEKLKERATKGGIGGAAARMQLAAANRAATGSFDVRATKGFGTIAGAANMKDDFGKVDAKKQNYKAEMEERAKKAEEKAKQYKPNDAAYAEAKEIDKSAKEAEERLKNPEFIKAEEKERGNTSEGKFTAITETAANEAKEKYDKANTEAQKIDEEIAKKTKEMQGYVTTTQKLKLEQEIKDLKEQSDKKKINVGVLKTLMDIRNKAFEDAKKVSDTYQSQERKDLEVMRNQGTNNEFNLNEQYRARLAQVASRIERVGGARTVMGGLGVALHTVGIGPMPMMTKSERNAIARRVRGVGKEKTKAEKAADANRDYQKEKDDAEAASTGTTPVTPVAPAPASTPSTPPQAGGTGTTP